MVEEDRMSDVDRRFALRAAARGRLFLSLSIVGVVVGLSLAVYYASHRLQDPEYPLGVRTVLVILILLNARQNLRQYRYANVLRKMLEGGGGPT
jgi:type III secretory pathway component EscS